MKSNKYIFPFSCLSPPPPQFYLQAKKFVLEHLHQTLPVTCVEWSSNGMKLFTGDTHGKVVQTDIDFYEASCWLLKWIKNNFCLKFCLDMFIHRRPMKEKMVSYSLFLKTFFFNVEDSMSGIMSNNRRCHHTAQLCPQEIIGLFALAKLRY